MTMVIDVISKGGWIGFPEIVTENFHEMIALCGKEIFMAQKWTIWFIIVGNELNVDWMSFPSHLGKLLSNMRQRVRAWVNTRWSEWKWMADFLCSCRDLNLCISRRADLKLPTSRISNEILLALFYTLNVQAKFPVSCVAAESSNLIFSFKYCWMIWMGMGNVIDQNSKMYDLHNVNIILRSRRHNLDTHYLRHSRTHKCHVSSYKALFEVPPGSV